MGKGITFDMIDIKVEEMKEDIIAFCQSLIQKKSVNPPGNEIEIAKVIVKKLEEYNLRIDLQDFTDNHGNIIATLEGSAKTPRLLYNGHLDVVPVPKGEKWTMDPFSGGIKRGKIWGRGTVDMKGNVAAMVMATIVLKNLNIPLEGDLILNFVSDEEQGGLYGTKMCIENHTALMKADATIIGEPTSYPGFPTMIMIGEKGIFWLKITVWGKSAHASVPVVGINPILKMLHIIQAINQKLEYNITPQYTLDNLKELASEVFGKEQFQRIYEEQEIIQGLLDALTNLTHAETIIHAGEKENVIPETCTALIDFRLTTKHNSQILLQKIKEIISDLGPDFILKTSTDDTKGNILLEIKSDQSASLMQKSKTNLIEIIKEAHQEVFQAPTFKLMMPATSDARFFRNNNPRECNIASICDNTVLFGGGNGTLAHSKNEALEIKTLLSMTKVYSLIATKYLS